MGDHFLENLQGLTTLKIYQADEARQEVMQTEAEKFRRITMKVLTMQLNSITIMDLVAFGGAALGIVIALMEFQHHALSVAGCLKKEMLQSMNSDPIVFAMANPDPEITPEEALSARNDVIMATGRSDYPNQINNVLGFPFIFRGALDVRATRITENMKMAAAKALAALAKESVPEEVRKAYGGEDFSFGREYIVPKPFDPRVIEYEAVAVAKAAVEDGVALKPITDWEGYRESLKNRMAKYW